MYSDQANARTPSHYYYSTQKTKKQQQTASIFIISSLKTFIVGYIIMSRRIHQLIGNTHDHPIIAIGDIGYEFRKKFNVGWFTGRVVKIRPGAGEFSLLYCAFQFSSLLKFLIQLFLRQSQRKESPLHLRRRRYGRFERVRITRTGT